MTSAVYAAYSEKDGEQDLVKIGFTGCVEKRFATDRSFVIFMTRPDQRDRSVRKITAGFLEQAVLRFCEEIGVRIADNDFRYVAREKLARAGYRPTPSRSTELIRFDEEARTAIGRHAPRAVPPVRDFLDGLLDMADLARGPDRPFGVPRSSRRPASPRLVPTSRYREDRNGMSEDGTDLLGASQRIEAGTGAVAYDEPDLDPSW